MLTAALLAASLGTLTQLKAPAVGCAPARALVFVHGYNGSDRTWSAWTAPLSSAEEARCASVYSFAYPTGHGKDRPSVAALGAALRDALLPVQEQSDGLVLVAHSMGGLVIEEMLLQDADAPRVAPALREVFFIASPHKGIRRAIPLFARARSKQVASLWRWRVRALHHRWEEKTTPTSDGVVFYAQGGELSFRCTAIVASRDGLVPARSAEGDFSTVLRLKGDHVSVKEPGPALLPRVLGALK